MYSVPVCICVCYRGRRCKADPGFDSTTRFQRKFDCKKDTQCSQLEPAFVSLSVDHYIAGCGAEGWTSKVRLKGLGFRLGFSGGNNLTLAFERAPGFKNSTNPPMKQKLALFQLEPGGVFV